MRWLYIGVGLSSLVLLAAAIWTITVLSAIAAPRHAPRLTIEVTGHQWWWEVKYPGTTPADSFVTANEIHIPVGEAIRLKLVGGDVIHSFWVPQLAGKMDMIPGQINYTWLQADKAGDYRGQCGEYCGLQHAQMALHVIAQTDQDFSAWRDLQTASAGSPAIAAAKVPTNAQTSVPTGVPTNAAAHGAEVFASYCSRCHAARGAGVEQGDGPDLTHLMSRRTIAAGALDNNIGNLSGWVANAQALKPGTGMPEMDLTPQELHAVVAYLQTLQ